MTQTVVEAWFGPAFAELHPLLQRLHREGGVLSGPVEVAFGTGLAGALGRRLAARMGVPASAGTHRLDVSIRSEGAALHWGRRFNGRSGFDSRFTPVGHYPGGHWVEQSGRLRLELGVEVKDGGWHWRHRRSSVFGLPLPQALLPRTLAFKRIEDGRYRFSVEVRAPGLGRLLSYSGALALGASYG